MTRMNTKQTNEKEETLIEKSQREYETKVITFSLCKSSAKSFKCEFIKIKYI